MDDLTIAGIAGGVVLIVRETIGAVASAFRERGAPQPPQLPPIGGDPGATFAAEIAIIRSYLEKLEAWAQQEAKDAVLDEQSRKAVLDISDALKALVTHVDRDRRDTEREREAAAKDRQTIIARLERAEQQRTRILQILRRDKE